MKIAEVCFSKSWGGLEHYVADCIVRLHERGHTVYPVVYPDSPIHQKIMERIPDLPQTVFEARDYLCPGATTVMTKLFRKQSIEAVHIHRTQDLGVVIPAAQLGKVPNRVFTLQMESDRVKKDLYHKYVYSQLTSVLTITERMKRLMSENVAVDPVKIHCNYYGIDPAELKRHALPKPEIRAKWNIPDDTFVIGIVGRLEHFKGQEILLEAVGLIKNDIQNLVVMIVGDESVGQSGHKHKLVKQVAEVAPVRVLFTGYRHPPGVIAPAFDVSVLASVKETFGLVVIEAMALGVPVIGTDAGGVPEIIESGVNGLLVAPQDAAALAEAVRTLYSENDLRRSLATAGQETVRQKFGLDRHFQMLERALAGEL